MKRILFVAAICLFGFSAFAGDLEIHVNPNNPYLIPASTPVNGGGLQAPYFNINNISLVWHGSSTFELLAIMFSSKDRAVRCGGSGTTMSALFVGTTFVDYPTGCSGHYKGSPINGSAVLNEKGNIIIPSVVSPACTINVDSSAFYCEADVPVSNNPFATYNIPVTVTVYGQNANGSKIIASQDIIVQ